MTLTRIAKYDYNLYKLRYDQSEEFIAQEQAKKHYRSTSESSTICNCCGFITCKLKTRANCFLCDWGHENSNISKLENARKNFMDYASSYKPNDSQKYEVIDAIRIVKAKTIQLFECIYQSTSEDEIRECWEIIEENKNTLNSYHNLFD